MELLKEGKYWTACHYKKIGMYVARIGWASPQGTQNCVYSIPGDVFEALGTFDDDNDNEKIIRDYGNLLRRFEDTRYGTMGPEETVYEKGCENIWEEAYESVMSEIEVLAAKGDRHALNLWLGQSIYLLPDENDNRQKICRFFIKAAEAGIRKAQLKLANTYFYGNKYDYNIDVDLKKAVYWFVQYIENENVDEHDSAGDRFYNDYQWYKSKPEEKASSREQCNLGYMYQYGKGVERSYEKAVCWYIKAADKGSVVAMNNLGACYEDGEGVEQDCEKAVHWYTKAAEQGNECAQKNLAVCYHEGTGVEQSYEKAVYWYTKAADNGNVVAMNNLGACYEEGKGVERDCDKAVYWYTKAAEQGDDCAQKNLAVCYYEGTGVEQSYEKAVYWFTKSAEQGWASAQNCLGECYRKGEGVEKDIEKAAYWFAKSAEQGNEKAQENLRMLPQE